MMIDKEKLSDELTEMFIWYQWRLENPMPSSNDTEENVFNHFRCNYIFNAKVKSLVSAVMQKVIDAEIQ